MLAVFAVVVLLCSTTLSLQQGCIGRVANPKKDLLCYYSGIMDSANLDPCVCTHLVLTGFSLDAEWNLHSARFDNLTFVDNLKETNRKLQVLVSFHLDTNLDDDLAIFTNISDDADNFAQKCTSFLQDNSLDGLELDWILTNSSSSLQHLQVLQTLGDNFKNSTNSSLVLTAALPNKAEDIIANYNVGNMSKYVDRIYLPAYGFFPTESNETFHPSRLMGVSDMQNADSLLDLVLSLGVPSEKIILGVPTFGIKYFLEHSNVTGIGAPTLGGPNVVAFHKICQQVKAGKWKVERDDDLTSPRAYSDDQWIAYDDEISIRTKGKYALLRGLAGVGVWALDDDDVSETCGEKKFPLASAARDILDQFQDAGQNMVMNSMTMDLETSASENIEQSVATLDSSSRAARSPSAFRITQIVDRLGRITAIFDNSQTELECTRAGYYRHPADCGRFFRCVKFDQFKDEFTVFEYDCPAGLVFDEKWSMLVRILLVTVLVVVGTMAESPFRLVCYYTNWAIYRPGYAKYTPENINPYMCTHLIYAFGGLTSKAEMKPFDAYNDIQQGNFKKFTDLKKHNPKLKTMIAIGGWNEGSKRFSNLVGNVTMRHKFVGSAMKFLRQHHFDGLDLDWEYPTFRDGSNPSDREGYVDLVREFRDAFESERLTGGREKLLLTMAVPAGQNYIDQGFDVPALIENLDFMNLLTYDYVVAGDGITNHHAPLYELPGYEDWSPKKSLNIDWTVNHYLELGAPADKIVVGIPSYGRAFTTEEENAGIDALATGPAEAGPSSREAGYLAYSEICTFVNDNGWTVERPYPDLMGPYAYKGNQWVCYDDVEIVTKKAQYVVENKLGGAMFWALDTEDFRGNCGEGESPLITAVRTVLVTGGKSTVLRKATSKKPAKITVQSNGDDIRGNARADQDIEGKPSRRKPKATTPQEEEFVAADEIVEEETFAASRTRGRGSRGSFGDINTPPPPTTPDPGPQFECADEGFFLNPSDCRKYFWCLDSGPADLGIIPHHFTCPSGLYFNTRSDSCDYPDNVSCKIKPAGTTARPAPRKPARPTPRTTTPEPFEEEIAEEVIEEVTPRTRTRRPTAAPPEEPVSEPTATNPSISQLLHLIEKLGGVEAVQKHLAGSKDSQSKGTSATEETSSPVEEEVPSGAAFRGRPFPRPDEEETLASTTEIPVPPTEEPAAEPTTKRITLTTSRLRPGRRRRPSSSADATTTEATTEVVTGRRATLRALPKTRSSTSRLRLSTSTSAPATEGTITLPITRTRGRAKLATSTMEAPLEEPISANSGLVTAEEEVGAGRRGLTQGGDEVNSRRMDNSHSESSVGRLGDTVALIEDKPPAVVNLDEEDVETHTFGATRIPGLFKYVLIRRTTASKTPENGSTEESVDPVEDATFKTEEGPVSVTEGGTPVEDVPIATAVGEPVSTEIPKIDSNAPFENIGVRLNDAEISTEELASEGNAPVQVEAKKEDLPEEQSTAEKPVTEPATEPSTEPTAPEPSTMVATTTVTTEPSTTTTEIPVATTTRRRLLRTRVKSRQRTTRAATVTTQTTTQATTTIPEEPTTLATVATTKVTTKRPLRTLRFQTAQLEKTTESSRVEQSAATQWRGTPSTSSPISRHIGKVRIHRKQSKAETTQEDEFVGLTGQADDQLECQEDGVYPHPSECNKFVSCMTLNGNIKAWLYKCPDGQLYDEITGLCAPPEEVECSTSV